jgi:hypothetical protein
VALLAVIVAAAIVGAVFSLVLIVPSIANVSTERRLAERRLEAAEASPAIPITVPCPHNL